MTKDTKGDDGRGICVEHAFDVALDHKQLTNICKRVFRLMIATRLYPSTTPEFKVWLLCAVLWRNLCKQMICILKTNYRLHRSELLWSRMQLDTQFDRIGETDLPIKVAVLY